MYELFISYAREDKNFVADLHDKLKLDDRKVWVDLENIPPSAEWLEEIFSGIEAANAFVFVISPDSIKSETCRKELEHAVKHNKRLIPIVCRDTNIESIPNSLAKLNLIYFIPKENFKTAYQSLITSIDTDLDWVHTHTRLVVKSREWEKSDGDKSFLLRGRDLKRAELWLSQSGDKEPEPTVLQRDYISTSREAAMKRRRILISGITASAVIAIVLLIIVIKRGHDIEIRTNEGISRKLAVDAMNEKDRDNFELALLLSLEAIRISNTIEARKGLLYSLLGFPDLKSYLGLHEAPVKEVVFNASGEKLVTVSEDGKIFIWNFENKKIDLSIDCQASPELQFAFLNQNKLTIYEGGDKVSVVDLLSQGKKEILLNNNEFQTTCAKFDSTGKFLALGKKNGDIYLWNLLVEPSYSIVLKGHKREIICLEFSLDGEILASGSGLPIENSGHNSIRLWDAKTGKPIVDKPLLGHRFEVLSLAFNPDGKTLASSGWDKNIILWDAKDGNQIGDPLIGHETDRIGERTGILSVAFSPDGKLLASCSKESIILWDLIAKQSLGEINGFGGDINCIAFSPDSKKLVIGLSSRNMEVLEVAIDSWKKIACRIAGRNLTQEEWNFYLGDTPYRRTCLDF